MGLRRRRRAGDTIYLAIESALEGFKKERNKIVQWCRENSIVMGFVRSSSTRTRRWATGKEKSDAEDSKTIFELAFGGGRSSSGTWCSEGVNGYHVKLADEVDEDERFQSQLRRAEWLARIVRMRRSGYTDEESRRIAEYFYGVRLPLELLSGKKLSAKAYHFAVVAEAVAATGGNRDDFDREVGLYSHGYPAITRGDVFRDSITPRDSYEHMKQKRRRHRRNSRLVFHIVRSARPQGDRYPETGDRDPAAALKAS